MTSLPAEGPAPHGAGPCAHGYLHGERVRGRNWVHTAAGWQPSGGPPYLVPPALQDDICKAFGVEPWHIGLAPAPPVTWWRRHAAAPLRRAWLKITGRW